MIKRGALVGCLTMLHLPTAVRFGQRDCAVSSEPTSSKKPAATSCSMSSRNNLTPVTSTVLKRWRIEVG